MRMIRSLVLFLLLFLLLAPIAVAAEPVYMVPGTIEVVGSGFQSLAFLLDFPQATQEEVSYSFENLPELGPPQFDAASRIWFWRPERWHIGEHLFKVIVTNKAGEKWEKLVTVKVFEPPTAEAPPLSWREAKKEERYLSGRRYFPGSNLIELTLAALPAYELEVRAKDSEEQEITIKYLPGEGRAEVSKAQGKAVIWLGGQYAGSGKKLVRRDLYEDLFNHFGLIFKKIESIKLKGQYKLSGIRVFGREQKGAWLTGLAEQTLAPQLTLYFDDRPYLPTVYNQKEPIKIADIPVIKIEFNTPTGLVWKRVRLLVDDTEYHAIRGDFSLTVVKPYKEVSPFDVEYAQYVLRVPPDKKLAFGEHKIRFEAEDAYGELITSEAFARVVTVPAEIKEAPVVYPSPFSPVRNRDVKIQYRLTMPANISIVLAGGDTGIIYKKDISLGEEGSNRGLNTIVWDGKSNSGSTVSNGIYVGLIIDRDENRKLEKFKIVVYN
jgi:hypothetical protein